MANNSMNIIQIKVNADSAGLLLLGEDTDRFEQWSIFQEDDNRAIVQHIAEIKESKRLPAWIHLAR